MQNNVSSATKRLLHDLRELQSHPFDTITAAPLEHDLFTWHANMHSDPPSPLAGIVFHFTLKFPPDYPLSPPYVQPVTYLPHPNVFESGKWLGVSEPGAICVLIC
jgi:ubiquitin-conjugating enzyme E2 G2